MLNDHLRLCLRAPLLSPAGWHSVLQPLQQQHAVQQRLQQPQRRALVRRRRGRRARRRGFPRRLLWPRPRPSKQGWVKRQRHRRLDPLQQQPSRKHVHQPCPQAPAQLRHLQWPPGAVRGEGQRWGGEQETGVFAHHTSCSQSEQRVPDEDIPASWLQCW